MLSSKNKQRITIEIDEELYKALIDKIGQKHPDEIIEHLIKDYVDEDTAGVKNLIEKWLKKKTAPYRVLKSYFAVAEKYGVNEVTQERMKKYAFNELHENNFQPNFAQMKNGGNNVSAYSIFALKYHPSWGNKVVLTDKVKEILERYKPYFLQNKD